jgi:hypothetical protein
MSNDDAKSTIKNLADKAKMSPEDLNKIHAEIKHDLLERGAPDDDKLEGRILNKMQARLKKRFVGAANMVDVTGSLFGRSNAQDRAILHHKITEAYIEKYGEEQALEDGYLDKKGNHLYVVNKDEPEVEINGRKRSRTVFDNQVGQIIPENDWEADGYGIINYVVKGGKDDVRFADFKLRQEAAIEPLPLFKECDMNVFIRNKKDKTKFAISMSTIPVVTEEKYIQFERVVPFVKAAYPDRVIEELKNVYKVTEDLKDDKIWNPWLLVKGTIIKVGQTKTGRISLNINDSSLIYDGDEDVEAIFVLLPGDMELDFVKEAEGYFFVNPTIRDGDLTLFGLGYWVENFERAQKSDVKIEPNTQAPWG